MMTIKDPDGTPSLTYNRDGTTIANLTASGTTSTSAAVITRHAQTTVVLLTTTATDYAVKFPTGTEVGDVVEIFNANTGSIVAGNLWAASGETFLGGSGNGPVSVGLHSSFRKVDSSTWAIRSE